jgi:hypothetical protein
MSILSIPSFQQHVHLDQFRQLAKNKELARERITMTTRGATLGPLHCV